MNDVEGSNYLEYKPHPQELLAHYLITTRERERGTKPRCEQRRAANGGMDGKKICSTTINQRVYSLTVLKLGQLSLSQVIKIHLVSSKKVGLTLKVVRSCKHIELQHGCKEFFPEPTVCHAEWIYDPAGPLVRAHMRRCRVQIHRGDRLWRLQGPSGGGPQTATPQFACMAENDDDAGSSNLWGATIGYVDGDEVD